MSDFVGGPDVKMDGVALSKEDGEESPRSPLYTNSQQLAHDGRQSFPFYLDSDDSEDSDHFQSRGNELQKLKARLSQLSVGNRHDQVRATCPPVCISRSFPSLERFFPHCCVFGSYMP